MPYLVCESLGLALCRACREASFLLRRPQADLEPLPRSSAKCRLPNRQPTQTALRSPTPRGVICAPPGPRGEPLKAPFASNPGGAFFIAWLRRDKADGKASGVPASSGLGFARAQGRGATRQFQPLAGHGEQQWRSWGSTARLASARHSDAICRKILCHRRSLAATGGMAAPPGPPTRAYGPWRRLQRAEQAPLMLPMRGLPLGWNYECPPSFG